MIVSDADILTPGRAPSEWSISERAYVGAPEQHLERAENAA